MYSGFYSSNIIHILPAQMIPASKKNDKWKEKCMDSLESIARNQYARNLRLIENYEMLRGRLIWSHYFDADSGYADMIQQMTKEFELPSYLRHYDIISPLVNSMSSEREKRPDIFKVVGMDEHTTNEYKRKKNELLTQYISSKINAEINQKLLQMGIDPNKQDFQSPEEQNAYNQMLAQQKQALTPPEIEEFMKTDFMTAAELWGAAQLKLDKERFRLDEKEKKEFEDMLTVDRCFRHFYLTGSGYEQETWNPVNVFFHKSPDVDYIEDGDYVGRIFQLTIADIIDRYGFMMTKDQLDKLENLEEDQDRRWNEAPGTSYVYDRYAVPFQGYPGYNIIQNTAGFGAVNQLAGIPQIDPTFFNSLYSGNVFSPSNGYYTVTEGYWKSQKKIGLVTFIDEETGIKVSKLVDENFIIPDGFKEITDECIDYEPEIGTVIWTWINEVWKGIKINLSELSPSNTTDSIYLDVKPLEFQFKGDVNIYGAKLPVCGQVFSPRNSSSQSFVDRAKAYQIGFNVAMNQIYQLMEKEIGAFIVMDVNMFPNSKDWGGEDAWDKWMLVAKTLGVLPADTSPQNTKGSLAAAGGQFPKLINLDLASQFTSRVNLAQIFRQLAYEQVGFNNYRLGNFASTTTATGVEQGTQQSYAQTESYFTMFFNYVRRCYRMNLDIAQYVQAKKKDVTFSYTKSDLSTAVISILGTDLTLADLHIYVVNSQEQVRQLEMMRQYALENNTAGTSPLDVITIIQSNSPSEIKRQLQASYEKQQAMIERQQQVQEEQVKTQREIAELKEQKADERLDKQLETQIQIAEINHDAKVNSAVSPDTSVQDGIKQQDMNNKASAAQTKNQLELQKQIDKKQEHLDDLTLEYKKLETQLHLEDKKLTYAQIMKGKELKQKAKEKKSK